METSFNEDNGPKIGDVLLKMTGIKKSFPGVQALKGVDFELKKGEVHALVGENGAGKSTLMKILMGVYPKDDGEIVLLGNSIDINTPEEAHEHGIGMIFQELSLVPQLDVAQNVFLGNETDHRFGLLQDKSMYEKTRALMEKYKVKQYFDVKEKVFRLSRGYSQIVEVLKALSRNTSILVMDEPTASLTKEEEDTLYEIILNLKSQGVTIVYISHRLEEIFRNCDRVTVFKDGSKVITTNIDDVNMETLIELMTGHKLDFEPQDHKPVKTTDKESALLRVENLSWKHRLKNISFHLNYGEVVGITGLMGSGKSEIARVLFGIEKADAGEIFIDGKKVEIRNPSDAIEAGMALVPEDRRKEGLVVMHSIADNISLPMVKDMRGPLGWFREKSASKKVNEQIESLAIKTPSPRQKARNLSGGNQQKVVVGKWLTRKPKILILDEPTVGVDVKTKSELRGIIQDLVKDNDRGVILFSSELNEIIQLSDRIIILYRGEVIQEYSDQVPIQEDGLHRAVQGIINE